MASTLDRITKEGKMCYILGDYNINLFKSETHSPTQDFLNNLYSNYFYPIIHKPTRVTDRSATLIDNIITNSLNKVLQSGIFTPGLQKSSKEKNRLYKKFLKNPTPLNQMSYKAYKNKFTHLLRSAKKPYFADKFKESSKNIKETWSIINQLLHKKKSVVKCPPHFSDSGKTFTDPHEIASKFNDFFVNIGASLAKKIKNPGGSPLDYIDGCFPPFENFDLPDSNEVQDIIDKLKPTAAGHDEIRITLVKEIKTSIVNPLTFIFSLSLETGVVPNDLKVAKVIPILKSDDPSSFTNYRPISILPCFSKILEKLVYKRILHHINLNKILYNHQYGFRKNHSAYMALIDLIDKITTALDNNSYAIGIFLDLSKAFDTVNHDILLSK